MIRPPPTSTLFPYTTLFRSCSASSNAAPASGGFSFRSSSPLADRKSTRLNSSHVSISYAVFCLKKKKKKKKQQKQSHNNNIKKLITISAISLPYLPKCI